MAERPLSSGPWSGMRYSFDPAAPPDPTLLYWAQNMMPVSRPGPYVRRKRDRYYAVNAINGSTIYWVAVWRPVGGNARVLVATFVPAVGNQLYEAVPSGADVVFNVVLSAATLTAAGVGFDANRPVSFLDKLVVAAALGGTKPWTWDGTTNGGIAVLTNCSADAVAPTVYYGKLFFIKGATAADRATIIWSEENQPNVGYEAGGFSNAWTLTQSGPGPLTELIGTNEGLYYRRQDSTGVIRGAVTPDFAAAGVHDNVSTTLGGAGRGSFLHNNRLWFGDQHGRPWLLPLGGGAPIALWPQLALLYPRLGSDPSAPNITGWAYSRDWHAVLAFVLLPLPAGGTGSIALVFAADSGDLLAVWTWTKTAAALYPVVDPVWVVERPLVVVQGDGANPARIGFYGDPQNPADDYVAESPAQTYRLLTQPLGAGRTLQRLEELDVSFWLAADGGATDTVAAQVSSVERPFQYGLADPLSTLPTQALAHQTQVSEPRRVWGLGRELRWAQAGVVVSAASALKAWGVDQITLQATPVPLYPGRS